MLIPTTQQKEWGSTDTTTRTDPPAHHPKEVREECGSTAYRVESSFRAMLKSNQYATYDYNKRRVFFLLRWKSGGTNEAVESTLQSILNDINELSKEEDRDGYIFKPTPHARKSAKAYITEAYRKTERRLPRPRVVPDGKGGIIMEWQRGGDIVKLGCVSVNTKRDYIYYRRGNLYDVIEASVDVLLKHLAG